ncbi:hypothetical protein PICSAR164_01328 [Mycobacterium avium subsp. paratuberculosis]|nr:hypothetical protein PICSAR164_01328 [Mycobacterium avium subsp. paratuberculosis]
MVTRLTTAPPSVSGSIAKCHPGPRSASGRLWVCSSSHASMSSRSRGGATISKGEHSAAATQR